MSDALDIRLLGPLDVRVDGSSIELGGAKPRAILAMLALRSGLVVSVDELLDAGWGVDPAFQQGLLSNLLGWPKDVPQGGVVWVFAVPK